MGLCYRADVRRVALLAGALALLGRASWAQTPSNIAETLYQEGRELVAQGRFAEACPKFAESQKIEPGTGTLLNLAACNEQLGKTATAWSQFSEAYQVLVKQNDVQRAEYAKERRDALAARVSKITIRVSQAVPDLTVTLDDVPVGKAAWGVGIAVDPGTHRIEARAPRHQAWARALEVGTTTEQQLIEIPALVAAPETATAATPAQTTSRPSPEPTADTGGRPLTTPVVIAGVATVALAAGAGVTGALYLSKKSAYDEINGQPGASRETIEDRRQAVTTLGVVNLALIGGAAAGAVTTLVLYLSTPDEPARVALAPWVSEGGAGTTLRGSF